MSPPRQEKPRPIAGGRGRRKNGDKYTDSPAVKGNNTTAKELTTARTPFSTMKRHDGRFANAVEYSGFLFRLRIIGQNTPCHVTSQSSKKHPTDTMALGSRSGQRTVCMHLVCIVCTCGAPKKCAPFNGADCMSNAVAVYM